MKTDDEDGTAMSMIKASAQSFDDDEMFDEENFEEGLGEGLPNDAFRVNGQYGSTTEMPV